MRHIWVLGLLAGCALPVWEFDPNTTGTTADTGTTAPVTSGSTGTSSTTSASTTAAGTAASSTTSDATGSIFLVDDSDSGGLGAECDVYVQDCPPGQKCAWTASEDSSWGDISICVPLVRDPLPDGAPCTYDLDPLFDGIDECGPGAMCFEGYFSQGEWDGQATCMSLCKGSGEHPYCDPGMVCVGSRSMWVCTPTCDPFAQDCPVGLRCDLYGPATLCTWDSPDEPRVKVGEPCDWPQQCELGATCIQAATPTCAGSNCCTSFCDLADPRTKCPFPGQQCLTPYDWWQPIQPSLGVCRTEVP